MSQITGVKCDFCDQVFIGEDIDLTNPISVLGFKIGDINNRTEYRLNDGHICNFCFGKVDEVMKPILDKSIIKEIEDKIVPVENTFTRDFPAEEG